MLNNNSVSPLSLFTILLCALISTNVSAETPTIKFATYNIGMGLERPRELTHRLKSGNDENLKKIAAIIQKTRPDVLLLNEFDRDREAHQASLFLRNYLAVSQHGEEPIRYRHRYVDRVNTGVDSGLDLDNNGTLHEPADAWGFGHFPYQYGMLVLSSYPISSSRTFLNFKWADMPGALNPRNEDGTPFYSEDVRSQLRLSSKSHWDLELDTSLGPIHFLVSHPTPPVFDGPEDRNGMRNHDEIRFWADYVDPQKSGYIYDDRNHPGGLPANSQFVIAGDLNADPVDGDSHDFAIQQLLNNSLVNASCEPTSTGGVEASIEQAGKNLEHKGNPAADTSNFNSETSGNLRVDYVLPSANLKTVSCGVFWPAKEQPGHNLVSVSDHRLVWAIVSK